MATEVYRNPYLAELLWLVVMYVAHKSSVTEASTPVLLAGVMSLTTPLFLNLLNN